LAEAVRRQGDHKGRPYRVRWGFRPLPAIPM
jgi:hypothetical protein